MCTSKHLWSLISLYSLRYYTSHCIFMPSVPNKRKFNSFFNVAYHSAVILYIRCYLSNGIKSWIQTCFWGILNKQQLELLWNIQRMHILGLTLCTQRGLTLCTVYCIYKLVLIDYCSFNFFSPLTSNWVSYVCQSSRIGFSFSFLKGLGFYRFMPTLCSNTEPPHPH